MHELAVMFNWASLARTCLQLWQQYAQCSATKQKQWVSLASSVLQVCTKQGEDSRDNVGRDSVGMSVAQQHQHSVRCAYACDKHEAAMDIVHLERNVNGTVKSSQQGALRAGLESCKCTPEHHQILFDCPFYSIIRGQHFSLFGPNYQQRTLGSFSNTTPTSLVLLHTTYTCAFKLGCLLSHNWLHTPDCRL